MIWPELKMLLYTLYVIVLIYVVAVFLYVLVAIVLPTVWDLARKGRNK